MSVAQLILNRYLRLTEKPHLARATPEKLRRSMESKAKLFFHPPRGTRFSTTELSADGHSLPALNIDAPEGATGPLILYFHGGGYIFGSPDTHKAMLARLAQRAGSPACLPRYRLAPEHSFPAAPEDALTAYRAVMDHPAGVVLGGDSAGGGLALSLLAQIKSLNLPQPLGTFCFSPLTDATYSAASILTNDATDVVLPAARTGDFARLCLQGADPTDRRVSPLFASFTGAGPVWIAVSDTEILLDDSTGMAARLREQRVPVTLTVEQNLPHVWPLFYNLLPEGRTTLNHLAQWIKALPPRLADS